MPGDNFLKVTFLSQGNQFDLFIVGENLNFIGHQ